MSTPDAKLIAEITEAVMRSMPRPTRAEVHPPLGTCKGERPTRPHERPDPARSGESIKPAPARAKLPVLHGVVTATQLQAALDAADEAPARLAHDARLTPLANDLARRFADRVQRVAAQAPASIGKASAVPAAASSWLWWIDGACPTAIKIGQLHAARLRPSTAPRSTGSLASVLDDLAQAVARREVAGGIVYSQQPAVAVAVANRHASLRAMQARDADDLAAAHDLGPNAIVIDYPRTPGDAMSAVVAQAIESSPNVCPIVRRHLGAAAGRGGLR